MPPGPRSSGQPKEGAGQRALPAPRSKRRVGGAHRQSRAHCWRLTARGATKGSGSSRAGGRKRTLSRAPRPGRPLFRETPPPQELPRGRKDASTAPSDPRGRSGAARGLTAPTLHEGPAPAPSHGEPSSRGAPATQRPCLPGSEARRASGRAARALPEAARGPRRPAPGRGRGRPGALLTRRARSPPLSPQPRPPEPHAPPPTSEALNFAARRPGAASGAGRKCTPPPPAPRPRPRPGATRSQGWSKVAFGPEDPGSCGRARPTERPGPRG